MLTSKTGLVRGRTIEFESTVPELEEQRVRVMLEPVDEPRLSNEQQRELWEAWIERGTQGPIEDESNTDIPCSTAATPAGSLRGAR